MNVANKVFKNNKTGESIKVIDSFENIAILENKQKIDVRILMDSNQYTEQIDPASFFNNQGAYNALAEKIKSIPTDHIKDEPGDLTSQFGGQFQPAINESAIIMSTEEDERAELAKKYGASMDASSSVQKQNETFAKLLDGENTTQEMQNIQRVQVNRDEPVSVNIPVQTHQVEDPIITMFRKTKRNVEFKISVDISDKIPRLDFIEMMEDSYEISMIDFLADEFTNKILNDPSVIRDSIKNRIKQLVYGAPTSLSSNNNTTNKEKTKTEKDSKNIQTVNDQITDSVTQFEKHEPLSIEKEFVLTKDLPKKTTTRKPRAKKESESK
jgi:hypothetical protein